MHNLQVGDFVLEINKDQKRGNWRCGRVMDTFPGEDGLVRAVAVQLEDHVTTRAVNTLCLLEEGSPGQTPEDGRPSSGENVITK